jgi:hypothetical protein
MKMEGTLMNTEIEVLQQWIIKSIENLAQDLTIKIRDNKTAGKIRYGIGPERESTITGYISYSPNTDPNEESVETAVTIKLGKSSLSVTADICWSDGEIIQVMDSHDLLYDSSSDLLLKLKTVWEKISPDIYSKMESFIRMEQLARYRKD